MLRGVSICGQWLNWLTSTGSVTQFKWDRENPSLNLNYAKQKVHNRGILFFLWPLQVSLPHLLCLRSIELYTIINHSIKLNSTFCRRWISGRCGVSLLNRLIPTTVQSTSLSSPRWPYGSMQLPLVIKLYIWDLCILLWTTHVDHQCCISNEYKSDILCGINSNFKSEFDATTIVHHRLLLHLSSTFKECNVTATATNPIYCSLHWSTYRRYLRGFAN